MPIDFTSISRCDWCGQIIEDDKSCACKKCYEELEGTVPELEKKIKELRDEIIALQLLVDDQKMSLQEADDQMAALEDELKTMQPPCTLEEKNEKDQTATG